MAKFCRCTLKCMVVAEKTQERALPPLLPESVRVFKMHRPKSYFPCFAFLSYILTLLHDSIYTAYNSGTVQKHSFFAMTLSIYSSMAQSILLNNAQNRLSIPMVVSHDHDNSRTICTSGSTTPYLHRIGKQNGMGPCWLSE